MDANEYQQLAARTLIDKLGFEISDHDIMAVWDAIGLAGEAGEVVDHIKKGVFHQHGIDLEKIKKELGDTLWYVAALCTTLELDMSEIMKANIEFAGKEDVVAVNIANLRAEIEAEVKDRKATVKGNVMMAVYVKPRVKWNPDILEGMIALVPQLEKARTAGEPSITFRNR